jgi:hypothetical protein
MKYEFITKDKIDLGAIRDTLQLDSGTVLAMLRKEKYTALLKVQGDVLILYNPDPQGRPEDGAAYDRPSRFPEELKRLIAEGADITRMPNILVKESNMLETFVYLEDGSMTMDEKWTGFSDGLCPEDFRPATLMRYMAESLEHYLTKDTGLTSRVESVRLTRERFNVLWAGINKDNLDEDDLLSYVEDRFAMYETEGFRDRVNPIFMSKGDDNYGQAFEVLRRANLSEVDLEAMPMWKVRFKNGNTAFCYPEEICSGHDRARKHSVAEDDDDKGEEDALYKEYTDIKTRLRKAILGEIGEKAKARGVRHVRFVDIDITDTPSIKCTDSYDGWATLDAVHMDDKVIATIDFSDSCQNYHGRIGNQDTETLHEILAALRGVFRGIDDGEYAVGPDGTVGYAEDED